MTISKFGDSYKVHIHDWWEQNQIYEDKYYTATMKNNQLVVSTGFGEMPLAYDDKTGHILLFNEWQRK